MPKLRITYNESRSRKFAGAVEKAKIVSGIKTDEELAAKAGFGTPSKYSYHKSNRFERLNAEQIRKLIKTLNLSGRDVCEWLDARYE